MPRRAPFTVDDLATRLAAIEADNRFLRDAVNRLIAMIPAARRPIDDDTQLLGAIANAVCDHVFSARELRNHATVDATLSRALGGASVKQIGKRLRSLADQGRIGPYRMI